MPRKTLVADTSKSHTTKERGEAREAVESLWRRGNLKDYEPMTLSDEGMAIFAALADAIPDTAMAKVDGYTLENAADALDQMRKCRQRIADEGLTVQQMNGNGILVKKPNDCIAILAKYSDMAKKWLVELGLTPSARGKVASDAAAAASRPQSLRELLAEDDSDDGEV